MVCRHAIKQENKNQIWGTHERDYLNYFSDDSSWKILPDIVSNWNIWTTFYFQILPLFYQQPTNIKISEKLQQSQNVILMQISEKFPNDSWE